MSRHTLEAAVRALAGVCDGAHSLDGHGYNGTDAMFGNRLAELPEAWWTPAMRREAYEMLAKYRHQLANMGVDYGQIPEPPAVDTITQERARQDARRALQASRRGMAPETGKRVELAGNSFAIYFPYDPKLVAEIKAVPGRRWDGAEKRWTAPVTPFTAAALKGFIERHGLELVNGAREELEGLLDAKRGGEPVPPPAPPAEPGLRWRAGRFELVFPYDPKAVEDIRAIPGRHWDKERGVWVVPGADVTVGEALKAFVKRYAIPVDAEAWGHLNNVAEEMRARLELSSAAAAEIDLADIGVPPGLAPYPFQAAGVHYALRVRRTFIADEMGLGKTIQAILTFLKSGAERLVVVCPASLKLNWRREILRWAPKRKVLVVESKSTPGQLAWADVLVVNYDILKVKHIDPANKRSPYVAERLLADIIRWAPDFLVLDESHYAKNSGARRTKACKLLAKGATNSQESTRGLMWRLLLTGTPLLNRPDELVAQLQILDRLEDLGGYQYFTSTYCNAKATRFGRDTSGADNLGNLNDRLRATCYVRRLKKDVLKELPPKQRSIVPVELSNRTEYDRAERDLIAWLISTATSEREAQGKVLAAMRAEQLVRMNALKQLAATGKLAAAESWIRDFLESGEKLIVFGHHRHIVGKIAETFNAPMITGDTPLEARQEAVDRFQTDEATKLIALNLQAGGVGLTLTAASNVAFLELGWTPALHDQAEDRAHRIGQEADSVNAWYILAEQSIDDDIYALIEEKRKVVTAVADGETPEVDQNIVAAVANRLRGRHA